MFYGLLAFGIPCGLQSTMHSTTISKHASIKQHQIMHIFVCMNLRKRQSFYENKTLLLPLFPAVDPVDVDAVNDLGG